MNAAGAAGVRLPMFPLGTVLGPYGLLPLHVFEPRYRVLMFDCLRGYREFGVVLIERGFEVGGDDQRFSVGTVARIAEAVELPDGRWFLLAAGVRRLEVTEWLPEDPYPLAMTVERPDRPPAGTAADDQRALARTEAAVRRALTMAGVLEETAAAPLLNLSEDPDIRAWQLFGIAPLEALDKQRLLAIDDRSQRLDQLAQLSEDRATLLAYRLDRE